MRLTNTQANTTKKLLDKAAVHAIRAVENDSSTGLAKKIYEILNTLPKEAMKLAEDVAKYEAEFTGRQLKIEKPVNEKDLVKKVRKTKVAVSIGKPKHTIPEVYKAFADTKQKELVRIVKDAKVLNEEKHITKTKIENIVNGLWKAQNKSLAGIAINGAAHLGRTFVAAQADMFVEWTIDLELNNCPYCEERDGITYKPDEVEGDIPMHANCGCTLVPVEG